MLPKYIHLFVVMAMIVAVVVVILLLLGDAAPKQKSYAGARVNFHYENDAFKLFLLLFILAGFFYLRFSGFNLCEFLSYWMPSLAGSAFIGPCS